jgi:serine/threonine protein kinase
MSLTPGARIGLYEIAALIGVGGMAQVYRAHDTRLGRSVAVKVLPEEFARDPKRTARLEREAKLLASLNPPNIAALYGLGAGGRPALPDVHTSRKRGFPRRRPGAREQQVSGRDSTT